LFPYLLVCSRADPVRKDTAGLLPRRVPLDGLDGITEPLATELSFCVGGGRILWDLNASATELQTRSPLELDLAAL
jgi:hypothetical protein